jgi:hypothetical protein
VEDVKSIYIALVDTIFNHPSANLKYFMLADSTILLREDWCQLAKVQPLMNINCGELQKSYDSVIQRNLSLRALSIPFDTMVVFVSKDSMISIAINAKKNVTDWFCVSAIGFDSAHQQAVVSYKHYCSPENRLCGSSYYYGSIVFKLAFGKWSLICHTLYTIQI